MSGFKVFADDRDAIQELKELALKKAFDVLLVFMFDRLDRIDSETPFVLEWFVQHGIEVWSVKEGQQKLDDHADKLINYVRFWQANGESSKISMRVKESFSQMTTAGIFRGGQVGYGYQLVYRGRVNKKGQPVKDKVINEAEAEIMRMMLHKTLYEGYGSYRLSEYINALGARTHNGKKFTATTILRLLRDRGNCGYIISGGTMSEKIPELAIWDENEFNLVNEILDQRSIKYEEKQNMARTTKGKTLLSGNIYCGHCGCHLNAANSVDKRIRQDGTLYSKTTLRYMCYHKARGLNDCDGQSVYVAEKIDNAVSEVVEEYLEKIKQTPRNKALELRYKNELQQKQKQRKKLEDEKNRMEKRLHELSLEISKSLTGESAFTTDVFAMSVNTIKTDLSMIGMQLEVCDTELADKDDMLKNLDFYYDQFISWADEFANASLEQKKMIICQLIKAVKVRKGYELEIEFNISYQQFLAAVS